MQSEERETTDGGTDEALSFEAVRMRSAIESRLFHADIVPIRIGRFVVLDVIGRGGMATVYRAYDPRLDRRVAVKLLLPGGASTLRLEREAQALARLNHPNVVTIHEVSDAADGVFVAMELVEGGTLEDWCRTRAPTGRQRWRKLVGLALQACDGLSAAHRAGLVHRDLKPANILVGVDERLRVADFGLAAMDSTRVDARVEQFVTAGDETSAMHPMTVTGDLVGTVAYMAPEQLDGHADAKSDQFGLCAAFYEAFFGERPYRGKTIAGLRESFEKGPTKPASGAKAPDFVARALLRGLSQDPRRRFADVAALGDALRSGTRTRSIIIGSVVAGAAVGAALTFAAAHGQQCAIGLEDLGDAWSDARRGQVREAFEANPSPAASATFIRVEAKIDHAAQAWVTMRTAACKAAQRSEPGADARLGCAEVARDAFSDLTLELTRGTDDLVVHAIDVTDLLGDMVRCDENAAAEQDTARGRELMALLQRGRVASILTQFDDARRDLEEILATTQPGEFPRLRAEASTELTAIGNLTNQWDVAAEHAKRALDDAELTGDPDFIARRWGMLGSTLQHAGAQADYLAFLFERARRTQARGVDELVRADLDWKEGGSLLRLDRCDEAKPLLRRAAQTFAAHDSPRHPMALVQLGFCETLSDKASVGLATLERALAAALERYPPDHPEVAVYYGGVGEGHAFALDEETALVFYERALAVYDAHPQFDPSNRASTHLSLGASLTHLYRDAEALEHFRAAIEILRGLGVTTGPKVGDTWKGIASAERSLGRYDEALVACEQALATRTGPDPLLENGVALLRAKIFAETGRLAEANVAIDEARATSIPDLATIRGAADVFSIAYVLTKIGRHGEAIPLLEEAVARLDRSEAGMHVALRWRLATATLAAGDEAAARAHTQQAKQLLLDGALVKPDVREGVADLSKQLGLDGSVPH